MKMSKSKSKSKSSRSGFDVYIQKNEHDGQRSWIALSKKFDSCV